MVGLADMPMGRHIDEAVDVIRDYIRESSK